MKKSFRELEISPNNYLLWIINKNKKTKYFSKSELNSCLTLSRDNKRNFLKSRSYIREVLSILLKIDPLKVPLNGEFGKIPTIPNKFGYISISHTKNTFLIGWSTNKIGVDIEYVNRKFNARSLSKRFYREEEINELNLINDEDLFHQEVLKMWVLKESAIKLNRGSISADLHNWQIELTRNIAINKSSNVSLKSFCLKYKNWYLGTASETINLNKLTPIICDDL